MTTTNSAPKIVGPSDGRLGFLGSIGVRFMIDGDETADRGFSLVEHPMSPHALAAPLHRHTREDEYSYVLEGKMGALLGDDLGGALKAEPQQLGELSARYGLEMQPDSVPELLERFKLRLGEPL